MIILHDIELSSDCILWANDTDRAAEETLNDDGHGAPYGWTVREKLRAASDGENPKHVGLHVQGVFTDGAEVEASADQQSMSMSKGPVTFRESLQENFSISSSSVLLQIFLQTLLLLLCQLFLMTVSFSVTALNAGKKHLQDSLNNSMHSFSIKTIGFLIRV